VEAKRRQTIDELTAAWAQEERTELIDGEIVRRPLARIEHGRARSSRPAMKARTPVIIHFCCSALASRATGSSRPKTGR
jgi:hypothetical protein